jgi:zinc finger protein
MFYQKLIIFLSNLCTGNCRIEIRIRNERDLSRQVVKSDYATITVPEIDLEIPPISQKGEISTVEGVISR